MLIPVTVVLGEVGVVIVQPGPLTWVQLPEPLLGVLPAMVTEVLHVDWSPPAFAVLGDAVLVIVTWSLEGVHEPLLIVHWNT